MNEEERAEIVARAIDALISGIDPYEVSQSHPGELDSLLGVAEERLLGSRFLARASIQHEQAVWRSVVRRLQDTEIAAVANGEPDDDLGGLADVVATRHRLAAQMAEIGEQYRMRVWAQVQSRLADKSGNTGVPHIVRMFRRRSDNVGSTESSSPPVALEPTRPPTATTPAMGPMAESTHDIARERVWAEVSSGAHIDDDWPPTASRAPRSYSRLVAIAAAAAAVAALLAPLPATGFAEHPVTQIGETIGAFFGAQEAAPPDLAGLPPASVVNGRVASVSEASALAGVDFLEPSQIPDGFALTSSAYYPEAIAGNGRGALFLTYASADATLVVYQEAAGGSDFAMGGGASASVTLSDGTPATLVQGSWLAAAGLSWASSGSQSLVFERAGVLVVIEVTASAPLPKLLFQVADAIR